MRMTILVLAAVLAVMEGVGALVQWLLRRKAKDPAETKTAADLPWWLPISFLEFRTAPILVCFGFVLYVFEACVFDSGRESLGWCMNWREVLFVCLLSLLLPLIPGLFRETGRQFSRRGILFAPRGEPSLRTTVSLGVGFLLFFLFFSVAEGLLWFRLLKRPDGFEGLPLVHNWKDFTVAVMASCSLLCGVLVWATSCLLFRFRAVSETAPGRGPRDVDAHLSIAVLRSFSIPTAMAVLTMVIGFYIRLYCRPWFVDLRLELFWYGWMVGLHLWTATVPLSLLARKAVPWWVCVLALGALAAMPVVVLFR